MKELILIAHIAIGVLSVVAAIAPAFKGRLAQMLADRFRSSIIGLVATGTMLMLAGAPITRTCISFTLTMALLMAFRYFSVSVSYK